MRLGIADHFGWAVAVTASADHEVVDRRRIELIEPGISAAPIHYSSRHLDELAAALPAPILSISLRTWQPDFADDMASQRRAPYEARADAIMYRQELAELAHARGWEVHLYEAKAVIDQALGRLAGQVTPDFLQRPRETLGPPWTSDHRIAFAATIVAA